MSEAALALTMIVLWHGMAWHAMGQPDTQIAPISIRWLCYCRSLPEEVYASKSREHPLIATRVETADANLGESLESLSPLERLLRCESEAAHEQVAAALWDSSSEQDAGAQLEKIAADSLLEWEAAAAPSRDEREGRIDENRG